MARLVPRWGVWLAVAVVLILALWSTPARADELGFRLIEHETPSELYVGQTIHVQLVVENTGDAPWSPGAGDKLCYHWRDADGEMLVLDGLRTELTETVAPGEQLWIEARLQVPAETGDYKVEWRMLRENVHWFPRPTAGEPTRVDVKVAGEAFVWSSSTPTVEGPLQAWRAGSYEVSLENHGAATWDSANLDFVSYHWWDADGRLVVFDGVRTPFSGRVSPGSSTAIEGGLRAPADEGHYRLEVEPVRDGVSWFGPAESGQQLSAAVEVTERGLSWSLLDHDSPSELSASSVTAVELWVLNDGREAWEPGDRLSYRWLDAAGHRVAEGPRTLLPELVEPGEAVRVSARLHAPHEPGVYYLAWELLREGISWFGPPSPPLREPHRVDVGKPELAWALEEMDELPYIWVSDRVESRVVIRNVGSQTWRPGAGDHLAYHWLDENGKVVTFDGRRTRFPGPVEPGETVELELRIKGPAAAGNYQLQLAMVREDVRWFGPSEIASGLRDTVPVSVRWFSGTLQLLLALGTGMFLVWTRRRPPDPEGRFGLLLPLFPVVWGWAAVSLTAITFAELSGIGFWPGGLAYTLSGASLVGLLALTLSGRPRAWLVAASIVALSVLALADLVYMHFYGSIVPLTALTAAHHLAEVRASIVALFRPSYSWLAPTPLVGIALAVAWPRGRKSGQPRKARTVRAVAAGVALLAMLPALGRLQRAMTTELGVRVFSERRNAARLGVFNAHLFDFARTVRDLRGREATPEERSALVDWFARHRASVRELAGRADAAGVAKDMNLVLIQVESAQGLLIGARIAGQEITPFMNRLHERGLYFSNVVDQTAQGKTSDGEYAVLASQHPLGAGALCFLRADNHFWTLAHVLKGQGYSTFSAHPFKRGFWNRAVLHPRYGFDDSEFRRELGPGPEVGWGLADGPFLERAAARLESLPKPFFAFLITLSLHHPYDEFPERFEALDLGQLEGTRLGNYLHAMNYFDRSLEQFFQQLEDRGLAQDTVVALYGDHDARLDLDDDLLSLARALPWSPSVFHRLERVPFFAVVPNGPTGEIDTVGGQVDVGPTLLHLHGIEPPEAFIGRPLSVADLDGFAAYPDGSAFADDRYFVSRATDLPDDGACFDARGTSRPRRDCDALAERSREHLEHSRAVLDFDLHRALADPRLVQEIETNERSTGVE
jgi:phosphoglycerol transferase MdoB-like AlkP superfamily enzyme